MTESLLSMVRERQLGLGVVVSAHADGLFTVLCDDAGPGELTCRLLQTSQIPVRLAVGDRVVVWQLREGFGEGAILGRLGRGEAEERPAANADELVLECREGLTLRCGEGSITMRKDGKILIKGKDLVSHAKRMNRIRGGSVTIN